MAEVHSPVTEGLAVAPIGSNPAADQSTDPDNTAGRAGENKLTAAVLPAPAVFVSKVCHPRYHSYAYYRTARTR